MIRFAEEETTPVRWAGFLFSRRISGGRSIAQCRPL